MLYSNFIPTKIYILIRAKKNTPPSSGAMLLVLLDFFVIFGIDFSGAGFFEENFCPAAVLDGFFDVWIFSAV